MTPTLTEAMERLVKREAAVYGVDHETITISEAMSLSKDVVEYLRLMSVGTDVSVDEMMKVGTRIALVGMVPPADARLVAWYGILVGITFAQMCSE